MQIDNIRIGKQQQNSLGNLPQKPCSSFKLIFFFNITRGYLSVSIFGFCDSVFCFLFCVSVLGFCFVFCDTVFGFCVSVVHFVILFCSYWPP